MTPLAQPTFILRGIEYIHVKCIHELSLHKWVDWPKVFAHFHTFYPLFTMHYCIMFYIIVMTITHSEKIYSKNKFCTNLRLITLNCSGFSCMIRTLKKSNIDRLIASNNHCTTRVFRHQINTKTKFNQPFFHLNIFFRYIVLYL